MHHRGWTRRTTIAAATSAMLCGAARSQGWPAGRTVRIVVPFPPGGTTDVLARLLGERLGELWGSSPVIENRSGAGGNIGTEQAARAEPDGGTILIASIGMATNRFMYPKLSFDPVADFTPVSLIATVPNVLIVGRHVPVESLPAFIAYAKQNPGRLSYGSSGTGSAPHLSAALFDRTAGTTTVHVPYRGTALAMQDILGGRIEFMFDNLTPALPHIQSGAVRAFGVTTPRRSQAAPDLPPIADVLPGYDTYTWFGFFLPAGSSPTIVSKLHSDTVSVLAQPSVRERLAVLGAEPVGSTPDELAAFLRAEMDKWGRVIREANITAG